jgi:formylglycine-generating enzyme required for sulfatase activity
MAGNVSEWVEDVYRPMTSFDGQDLNYFRGNRWKKYYKNADGEVERDSMGRLKKVDISDDEVKNRSNYQRNNVIDYLDGDSLSQVTYGYGVSTLVNDMSRVIKGGSWNDMPHWLSPGTRRYMQEYQASNTVGFRCAQNFLGAPEGPGFKEGNLFGARKQNSKKKK